MFLLALFTVLFSFGFREGTSASHPCLRPCDGKKMTCRFNFTMEWYRTMSKACYDCPFNVTDCFREQCVSADGKVRAILAINRQVPGPAIEVCEGDTVEVQLTNHLVDGLATSLHWHGMHMRGTQYFDGVGQVTQCNIQHQEVFTYRFSADPAGTHWYHAHTGMQLSDGAFGPLIVRQPAIVDPHFILYDHDLSDHVLMVYDWTPVLSMARFLNLMHVFDWRLPLSVLVNGRGRKYNVTNAYGLADTNLEQALTPLEVLRVEKGKKYRLRVIGVSPVCPLQVSVDKHHLMVISVDGAPLKPMVLDAFIIHPGERYDFVLYADQNEGNYWLRVLGFGDCEGSVANGAAIVRYQGAPKDKEPSGDPTLPRDGILMNPILFDKQVPKYGFNRSVILTDDMRNIHEVNYKDEQVDVKFIIGMDYNNNDNTVYNNKRLYPVVHDIDSPLFHSTPVMDNITFILPPVPLLSQPQDTNPAWFCNRQSLTDPDRCLTEDLCMCTHLLKIPLDKVVEVIVFHEGRFFNERGHNMHLHGYNFRLLGLEKVAPYLNRSRLEQMDARGELKRNFIGPPVRDTVNVPDGGYAIIRFKADNPGFWFFHCHTDSHLAQGMALLFQVGELSDLPSVPSEFPRCGGMGFSNAHTINSAQQHRSSSLSIAIGIFLCGLMLKNLHSPHSFFFACPIQS